MKCYNKACKDHGTFDTCNRDCADICGAVQKAPGLSVNDGLNAEEPPPVGNDLPAVWDLVLADMAARDSFGKDKYSTRLKPFDGRDALIDAYQEALDLVVYLRKEIYQRDEKEKKDE